MSNIKHTPLEWQTDNRPKSYMDAMIYGDCNTDNMHAIATVHMQPDDEHIRDARYIARACNAYPALVEALLTIAMADESVFGYERPERKMIAIARAALAQAQGDE